MSGCADVRLFTYLIAAINIMVLTLAGAWVRAWWQAH